MSENPRSVIRESSFPNVERVIFNIVTNNKGTFFSGSPYEFDYQVQRVYLTNIIRELNNGLLDIPYDLYHAYVQEVRLSNRNVRNFTLDFIRIENDIVPLGTHVRTISNSYRVYRLNGREDGVASQLPLPEYILNGLPECVLLTRVLSEDEALKFARGANDLGSSHPIFWQGAVHTAIHNFTNEFEDSDCYKKAVKFKLMKSQIADSISKGHTGFGTCGFVFKNRDQTSPFPFEVEAVFTKDAITLLLDGYRQWVTEDGQSYINNPFYHSPQNKV